MASKWSPGRNPFRSDVHGPSSQELAPRALNKAILSAQVSSGLLLQRFGVGGETVCSIRSRAVDDWLQNRPGTKQFPSIRGNFVTALRMPS